MERVCQQAGTAYELLLRSCEPLLRFGSREQAGTRTRTLCHSRLPIDMFLPKLSAHYKLLLMHWTSDAPRAAWLYCLHVLICAACAEIGLFQQAMALLADISKASPGRGIAIKRLVTRGRATKLPCC